MDVSPGADEIAERLEDSMQSLAVAGEIAEEAGRDVHAAAIRATLAQVEDLRQRNEEFDPNLADVEYPRVMRRWGTDPYAIRIAVARDFTRAIYKSLEATTERIFRTPYYILWPKETGEGRHRMQAPTPIRIDLMAEVDSYLWDEPDELTFASKHAPRE